MPKKKFWSDVSKKIKFSDSSFTDSANPKLINFLQKNAAFVSKTTLDVSSLDIPAGDHAISVVAKAKGFEKSAQSNEVDVTFLRAPTISLNGDIVSWEPVEGATSYDVEMCRPNINTDGYLLLSNTSSTSYDLSTSNESPFRGDIRVVAKSSNTTSPLSNGIIYQHGEVEKGQSLTTYQKDAVAGFFGGRVLAVDGNVAKIVLSISEQFQSSVFSQEIQFGNTQIYKDSTLDNFLNNTLYGALNSNTRNAIIDTTIAQDKWQVGISGNPSYVCVDGASIPYSISLLNNAFGEPITRHIYALSVKDVIDYLGATPEMTQENTTMTIGNIQEATGIPYGSSFTVWLSSANGDGANSCMASTGSIVTAGINNSLRVSPAFTIDLSKCVWEVI